MDFHIHIRQLVWLLSSSSTSTRILTANVFSLKIVVIVSGCRRELKNLLDLDWIPVSCPLRISVIARNIIDITERNPFPFSRSDDHLDYSITTPLKIP